MGVILAGVTVTVEVAFANNPFDSSLTWTDISRYVEGFSVTTGRQHELQTVNPSTANVTLWNGPTSHGDTTGGRFSPWNTGSPYYHSGTGLTPGHPVRIQSVKSSTTYDTFYGYTKAFVPKYGQSKSEVVLQCYDLLALLNLNTLDTGQYVSTVLASSPTAYWQCADLIGSGTFADSSGHGNTAAIFGAVSFGVAGPMITETLTAAALSSSGLLNSPITNPSSGTVAFEAWFQTSATDQVLMDFPSGITAGNIDTTLLGIINTGQICVLTGLDRPSSNPPSGMTPIITGPDVSDGNWHHVVINVPCGTNPTANFTLYVDGVSYGTALGFDWTFQEFIVGGQWQDDAAIGGGIDAYFKFAGNIGQVAYYTSVLSAATILQHYQIGSAAFIPQDSGSRISAVLEVCGVPSALNNVGVGVIQCQGATSSLATTTAKTYLDTVVNTERGLLWQDGNGVMQYANREYVYTNSSSTTSQATFGYATGQLHYYSSGIVPSMDDVDEWNNCPVQRQGGAVQTSSNAASITAAGRRTLQGYTSLLFTNDADSLYLSQGLLYQYANPQSRVRALTTDSTIGNGAALPQMLGRQLLDRITINWRPIDGSSVDFSQQSLIEQITHTVTPEVWSTTFAVTPIGTEQFLILNSASQGLLNTGVIGF